MERLVTIGHDRTGRVLQLQYHGTVVRYVWADGRMVAAHGTEV